MNYEEARRKLEACGQGQVLKFWSRLDAVQRTALLAQVEDLDTDVVARVQAALQRLQAPSSSVAAGTMTPAPVVSLSPQEQAQPREDGEEALRAGKVGVILVAGGQGTRLGFDGPKGTYPLAPLSRASLFEIHARKILALERRFRTRIPFYIMTSRSNDADTRTFFEHNAWFGLTPERVQFFTQGVYPAFWPDGRLVIEEPHRIFTAPDGHGGVLAALARTGRLADMQQRGLETLFYFQVDNPLVEIADPVFIGLHRRREAEMSLKVCAKRDPEEGLGMVVQQAGRWSVVEYTELSREQKYARQPDGELQFKFGSVAIHVFALSFLLREAAAGLPLHPAHKKVPYCDEEGRPVKPDKPNAYKFEKFIFDALPDARNPLILEFAREEEFAPVKNAEGQDSPESTRLAMMEKFARWLKRCGVDVPRDGDGRLRYRIEIDPAYANGAEELRHRLPPQTVLRGDLLLADQPPVSR